MNPSVDYSQLPLRDIHLPDAVGWWPPAPGWWLILFGIFAVLVYAGIRRYRFRRHRAALRALAGIAAELERGAEPVTCLQTLSAVLRRFVMTVAQPSEARTVPGLTGTRWLEYLDERWTADAFRNGVGRMLLEAPYAPEHSVSPDRARELTSLCADWIRAQQRGR
jgi:hypothetical protein